MAIPLNRDQAAKLAGLTGVTDAERLALQVKDCGFDEHAYLDQHADLRRVGLDPSRALLHFLEYGYGEDRDIVCGPLGDGLAALAMLAMTNRDYSARLFRSIFFGQLSNPATEAGLWDRTDGGLVDCIIAKGGLPYIVIGDSHVSHYRRRGWLGERWFAPLCFVCHAASAMGLANEASRTGHGARILRWAETAGHQQRDIPVFLKFGGLDAEFAWMSQRLRDGIRRFSRSGFEEFARQSVARYGMFLDRLRWFIDAERMRVCSVFPTALTDARWMDGFVWANAGSPDHAIRLAAALREMEVPDLRVRTALRAFYNKMVRAMCEAKGLPFVDDFTPLIGPDGVLASSFFPREPNDHHLDFVATEQILVTIIRSHTCPSPALTEQRLTG